MESILMGLAITLGIGLIWFWIWMLVDCLKHESREGHDKLIWVIVIVATKFIGAFIYYFVRRAPRLRLEAS